MQEGFLSKTCNHFGEAYISLLLRVINIIKFGKRTSWLFHLKKLDDVIYRLGE